MHLERDCCRCARTLQQRRRVARIVAPVFRAKDALVAKAMYHKACELLWDVCPKAAEVLEEAEPDALAYLDFPQSHWKRLRTNNVQERTNREIKRRSRVVQVFPSVESLGRLAGTVMCEQDEAWSQARYFSDAKMDELLEDRRPEEPTEEQVREAEVVAFQALRSSLEPADRLEAA